MSVLFDEKSMIFRLSSADTTYAIAISEGYLCHLYYGARLDDDDDLSYLIGDNGTLGAEGNLRDKAVVMDKAFFEYPCFNTGDYREHALEITDKNGAHACELKYISHRIYGGKSKLEGLPASLAGEKEADTLEIICGDAASGLEGKLLYTVFEKNGVITRSAVFTNTSDTDISLERAFSASVDINRSDFDMLTLNGSWARECHISRHRLHIGKQSVDSIKGESSHQHNPFFALCDCNADEEKGEAYGFTLMYSGNFTARAEVNQFGTVRASIGINPLMFSWNLSSGESFCVPEAVMVYSDRGLGGMSRKFHDFFRNHVIRSDYKFTQRPVLINSWEAAYFDFDAKRLLGLAQEASKLGIEMLVMDDGWFGHRDSDNSSLGDWYVYEKKLGCTLNELVEGVNSLGMKFGLWIEPEMISPDSDLFRRHPDWALRIPGREMTMAREQYVLDFSRSNVRDYIYSCLHKILSQANIEYVKWDMNRPLTEVWSAELPPNRQGEVYHRYVLGVYEFMERLITDFPDILLGNCSGGGGRFDGGMLYYSPQIWNSDDTDAYERLKIQQGTSLVYPPSAMGAHISVCPNHITGRSVPMNTRANTALAGTFGYELDVTRLSEEEKGEIPKQIELYKKYSHLVLRGDYYRLGDVFSDDGFTAWSFVSKDRTEAIVTFVTTLARVNYPMPFIKLRGLAPDAVYLVNGMKLSGKTLMNAGIPMKRMWGDFQSDLIYIEQVYPEVWDAYNEDKTKADGVIIRREPFPKGVYHAVAEIIVRHIDGTYLVTKRDPNKETSPGKWEIGAGGSVLRGESFEEGAARELFEETGIKAQKLIPIFEESKMHENGFGAHYYGYLCETDTAKDAVVLQEGETTEYKWITAQEAVCGEYISDRAVKAVKNIIGQAE